MIIPPRYNGPPDSANGGYTAGLLAGYVASATGAVITLHRPPPVAVPMDIRERDGAIEMYDGDRLIASAAAVTEPLLGVVPPVTWADATAAAETYAGLVAHPFPTCFVCGPQRLPGDGLRLFPGRLPDGRTAAPWTVPADIEPALVWAALDCPGGWSVPLESRPYVLGRMSARVDTLPAAGDGCVVVGVTVASEGRKAHVVSTVYGVDGTVLARARATWIAIAA